METTSVYADIVKHERNQDGDLVVYGRATGPDLDLDQQICDKGWLAEAVPSWFKSGANLREQHQAIAAGVGQEITQSDDGGWDLKALVVDPVSARKVETGVLKGYSIGIRNPKVIKDAAAPGGRVVSGSIVEISLVDRPCNSTCQLTLAKAAKPGMTVAPGDLDTDKMLVKVEELHESPDTVLKVVDAKSDQPASVSLSVSGDTDTAMGAALADAFRKGTINLPDDSIEKRQFSDKERQRLADSGAALPDGSFPIKTVADLRNAIQAIGRAKDPAEAKAHIKTRAKALGKEDLIPDSWKAASSDLDKAAEDGMWVHDPAQLAAIRNGLVAVMKAELDELDDGDHELCDVSELLTSLSLFLAWWDSEAQGGETTSPYTGDDNTSGGPLMAVNLSAEADATKTVDAPVEKGAQPAGQATEAVDAPAEPVEKAVEPDVAALIKDAVAAAVTPLLEQVKSLRPAEQADPETPAEDAEKGADAEDKPDLAELVKAAVAEATDPIRDQVAKALAQPAPGGPVLTRTTETAHKAASNEALLTKAAEYDRLASEVDDRDLAQGYRDLAAETRAKATRQH